VTTPSGNDQQDVGHDDGIIVGELEPIPVTVDPPVITGDPNTQATLAFSTDTSITTSGAVQVFSTTDLTSAEPSLTPVDPSQVSATIAASSNANNYQVTATVHQEITEDSRLIFKVDCGNGRTARGEVRVAPSSS